MDKVFVNGIGIVHAAGFSLESVAKNPNKGGAINNFKFEDFVNAQKSYLDRSGEFTLAASAVALKEVNYTVTDEPNWDFGVVTASMWGATETLGKYTQSILTRGAKGANSILFTHLYQNSPVSILAIDFHLAGHHLCHVGANSAINAISAAYESITLGRAKNMLVVCYDIIPVSYGYYDEIKEGATAFILSKEKINSSKEITEKSLDYLKSLKDTDNITYNVANNFLLTL